MAKRKILWVENDPDFLNVRSEFIEAAGYEVLQALTIEAADQLLQDNWVHLIILDIRMIDDDNNWDKSGLEWADGENYRSLPKIILTGYASRAAMLKALRPGPTGQQMAVDFLDKNDEPEEMIEAINQAFAQYVRLNPQLDIRWNIPGSFMYLASLIEPELDTVYFLDRANELADLFRRLFCESSQIVITRLFTTRAKRVTVAVHAFSQPHREKEFVVVCGHRAEIKREAQNHEMFFSEAMGENNTIVAALTETVHFAAIAYVLSGADLAQVTTLTEYYRYNSAKAVINVLNQLFNATLAARYKKGQIIEHEQKLKNFLLKWGGVNEQEVSQARLEQQLDNIYDQALSAGLIQTDEWASKPTIYPVDEKIVNSPFLTGVTYGRLDGEGVLVDGRGRTWLIDFSQVERGPLLRDFVSLEIAIKLDFLATTAEQTQARFEMERRLLALSSLDEKAPVGGLEAETQKALRAISQVRQLNQAIVGQNMNSYLAGLLFATACQLAQYNRQVYYTHHELLIYLHSLLSVRMLCKALMPQPPTYDKSHSPWLEEDKPGYEIWVEGQWITLSETEYKLLLVLYQQAVHTPENPRCTFEALSRGIYGGYDKTMGDVTNLHGLVRRLRKKIQLSLNSPHQYIENVRGVGYSLNLNHHKSPGGMTTS